MQERLPFFNGISAALNIPIKELPYAVFPVLSGAMKREFVRHCLSDYWELILITTVYAPVMGSEKVSEFMAHGTKELLGSEMIVDVDHVKIANQLVEDFKEKRKALGWTVSFRRRMRDEIKKNLSYRLRQCWLV